MLEISKKFWLRKNKLTKVINPIIKKLTLHTLEKNIINKKPTNNLRMEKGSK